MFDRRGFDGGRISFDSEQTPRLSRLDYRPVNAPASVRNWACSKEKVMPDLSDEELRLIQLLIQGAPNKSAAKQMGLSLRTIEFRRRELMKKLGAESPVQLGYLYAKCEADYLQHS